MSSIRTRWAALGAAIAVTLGGGGIGLVAATSPAEAVTFIPITPCRVMDTRPAPDTVGDKASPLGGGETHTVVAIGASGNCTEVPGDATAVSLNVTAIGATLPTFLTVWAAGATQPEASSLNPVPSAPPTPNAVTTELNVSGEFSIFNLQGNVDVLADINGYYVDHDHDDRYYTEGEIDTALADKATNADVDAAVAEVRQAVPVEVTTEFQFINITTATQDTSVALTAPADGTIVIAASCWLDTPSDTSTQFRLSRSTTGSSSGSYEYPDSVAGSAPIYWADAQPASAGQTWTIGFAATHWSGGGEGVKDCDRGVLSARWTPTP